MLLSRHSFQHSGRRPKVADSFSFINCINDVIETAVTEGCVCGYPPHPAQFHSFFFLSLKSCRENGPVSSDGGGVIFHLFEMRNPNRFHSISHTRTEKKILSIVSDMRQPSKREREMCVDP